MIVSFDNLRFAVLADLLLAVSLLDHLLAVIAYVAGADGPEAAQLLAVGDVAAVGLRSLAAVRHELAILPNLSRDRNFFGWILFLGRLRSFWLPKFWQCKDMVKAKVIGA